MAYPATRPDPEVMLTPAQVAGIFNVTPKTASRWHEAGILPARRTVGGHRRFPSDAVYDLLVLLEEVGEC